MVGFCDLLGTQYAPVSKILSFKYTYLVSGSSLETSAIMQKQKSITSLGQNYYITIGLDKAHYISKIRVLYAASYKLDFLQITLKYKNSEALIICQWLVQTWSLFITIQSFYKKIGNLKVRQSRNVFQANVSLKNEKTNQLY